MEAELKEAQKIGEQTKKAAEDIGSRARTLGSTAWERAKSGYSTVQDKTVAGAKVTDEAIRTHPYQTLGIAFGIGVLIGFLLQRRD